MNLILKVEGKTGNGTSCHGIRMKNHLWGNSDRNKQTGRSKSPLDPFLQTPGAHPWQNLAGRQQEKQNSGPHMTMGCIEGRFGAERQQLKKQGIGHQGSTSQTTPGETTAAKGNWQPGLCVIKNLPV